VRASRYDNPLRHNSNVMAAWIQCNLMLPDDQQMDFDAPVPHISWIGRKIINHAIHKGAYGTGGFFPLPEVKFKRREIEVGENERSSQSDHKISLMVLCD
jgi:hypothetical protein